MKEITLKTQRMEEKNIHPGNKIVYFHCIYNAIILHLKG